LIPPTSRDPIVPERSARTRALHWASLVLASGLFALLLETMGLPAGLLLGAMGAAMLFATLGVSLALPHPLFVAGQAVVGCMIGGRLGISILTALAPRWPLFLGITFATIAASAALGYLLSRWRVIPGTVAIWGSTPGGATAMVLMAQAHGADARLVAVMVYARVVAVALTASILSALVLAHPSAGHALSAPPAVDPAQFVFTLAVGGAGAIAGNALRIPAGGLVGALALAAVLNMTGVVHIVPPRALLALAYAIVGWRIGLAFTRETVRAAARALPGIVLAAALLIAFCAGLALVLVRQIGIDPATAYLATSPGGLDSVAIIAASSIVDLPFVMALQMLRFVLVMLIGPMLAGALARRQRAARADET
jgi:membrane AbrB-like protein